MSKILIILDVDYLVKHGLSNNEGAVLNVLAYRSRDGLCKIGYGEIAKYANVGRNTVKRVLNTLIDKGLLLKDGDLYMVCQNGTLNAQNGTLNAQNGTPDAQNGTLSKERERKEAKERIKKERVSENINNNSVHPLADYFLEISNIIPPKREDVEKYCAFYYPDVMPPRMVRKFYAHYSGIGWKGVVNWCAKVVSWAMNEQEKRVKS